MKRPVPDNWRDRLARNRADRWAARGDPASHPDVRTEKGLGWKDLGWLDRPVEVQDLVDFLETLVTQSDLLEIARVAAERGGYPEGGGAELYRFQEWYSEEYATKLPTWFCQALFLGPLARLAMLEAPDPSAPEIREVIRVDNLHLLRLQ